MDKLKLLLYRYKFLILYTVFGLSSLLLEFVVIRFLSTLNIKYPISAIISLLLGIIFAFTLNIKLNFKISKSKRKRALIYFTLISSTSFIFQFIIRKELTKNGISMEISRFLISSVFFLVAYFFHRKYTFKEYKKVGVAIYANGVEDIKGIYSKISDITDFIHIDIVDNTFNNKSEIVKAYKTEVIRAYWPEKEIEVHIMSKNPSKWINSEICDHVDRIYFHLNIDENIEDVISKIESYGISPGIVINNNEDYNNAKKYFNKIENILVLCIENPGYSGQEFNMSMISTIEQLNKEKLRNKFNITVDGGVNKYTVKHLEVDSLVSGSFVLSSAKPIDNIFLLKTSGDYERF